ncbi:MAG: hypothetical protein MJE63_02415 [Proteobacteria bacterium]|nr:hypothetical protein [Pseudomonadota bacterium]
MKDTKKYYSNLAPFYHLFYPNWEESINCQAAMFDCVIKEKWGNVSTVLDVSCGIGTQAIGLAKLGMMLRDQIYRPKRLNEQNGKQPTETYQFPCLWRTCAMPTIFDKVKHPYPRQILRKHKNLAVGH